MTDLDESECLSLEDYEKITRGACCWACERRLRSREVKHHDHEGGWKVKGFDKKQWLYYECGICGYLTSLDKLGVKRP